jgi:hypothetical protein
MYNRKTATAVGVIGLVAIGLVVARSTGSYFAFGGMNLRHENIMADLYSNNEARVQQMSDSERVQFFSYSIGVLKHLQNRCAIYPNTTLNNAAAGLLAGLSGGMTAVSLIREGEMDMNTVVTSKGCRSDVVQTIARAFND